MGEPWDENARLRAQLAAQESRLRRSTTRLLIAESDLSAVRTDLSVARAGQSALLNGMRCTGAIRQMPPPERAGTWSSDDDLHQYEVTPKAETVLAAWRASANAQPPGTHHG